jgi:hypothetical protein
VRRFLRYLMPDITWHLLGAATPRASKMQDTDLFLARWDKCGEFRGRFALSRVGASSSCQTASNEADSVFTLVFLIRAPFHSRGFFFVIQQVTARMKGSANQPIWPILPQEGLCLLLRVSTPARVYYSGQPQTLQHLTGFISREKLFCSARIFPTIGILADLLSMGGAILNRSHYSN